MFKRQLLKVNMPTVIRQKNFTTGLPKGDLFKFQSQLPKLPVPKLSDTADKYLRSITPFLTPQQLAETKSKVDSFVNGKGQELQSRLQDFASTKDNWLGEWWDDYAYLTYRDPVVPYVSYFFAHKDINNLVGKNQLLKSTLLAYYTIEFMLEVQNETLAPEVIKGNPYCMNAFRYMFNNSRVPAENADVTKVYDGTQHRYFVVIYKNNFYKVNHHDANGNPISKAQIYQQLSLIVNNNVPKSTTPIGILTSLNRDEFVDAYNQLQKSPVNSESLETIFASSFVICLDDTKPVSVEEKSALFWHGDGQNRYFDKPLEFFIAANGSSGFLGEHSKMDATPTVQLNNYVYEKIKKENPEALLSEVTSLSTSFSTPEPALLPFDINATSRKNIETAITKFNNLMETYDAEIFHYHGYGKNLIKKFKVSPDAYVQMMMQLAYYKLTGKVRPTYESAATRKFLNGRTETGRSASIESKQFVETWTDPKSTSEAKIATFQAACKQHVKYLSEAADGQGVDRHLFGLKQMIKPGEEVPEIFQDPIFAYSQTWFLSTSQVPSENFVSWGWSQVIDEGFGLAYLVNSEWLNVHISSKKGQGLSSAHFKWYLTEAATEMKQVLSDGLLEPKAKL
jgi:carnitine O-acetyltransferase